MRPHQLLLLLTVFLFPGTLLLGSDHTESLSDRRGRQIAALPVPGQSIHIDGRLEEEVWSRAPRSGEFTQRDPVDGADASASTIFSVLYDDESLYVGIRAFDPDPDQISAILTRRDEYVTSDWIYVSVDSYNDNRTAFEFGLNAAGVKHDLRRFDDSNSDWDWDAVWEGAVSIDDQGWIAEFQIPFRELRFANQNSNIWGFNVYREFPRNDNELDIWSYWSKDENGFVSNYGTLTGIDELENQQSWYVQPYAVGSSGFEDRAITGMDGLTNKTNIGADIRRSFQNGLTLNMTLNPDFGQVEADPAEFNLTEFESYFREKRPFFLEGGNILNYSLGFGDGNASANTLFYSRRIGRAPHGYAQPDREYSNILAPDWTRILAAGKLTGKLENGTAIGFMGAITPEEHATIHYLDGGSEVQTIEPLTTYALTRIQKDYRQGKTTLGGIVTAVNRRLDGTGLEYLRSAAYTGGVDVNHRWGASDYQVIANLAVSHIQGSQESILLAQTSPARYFQRPDAYHLTVDSSSTQLDGWAGKLIAGKAGGNVRGFVGLLATSPGFEVNDLGFLRSVDNINQFVWVGIRQWDPGPWYLSYNLNFNEWANWNFDFVRTNYGGNVNGYVRLRNNWGAGAGIGYNGPGLNISHLRGGPAIVTNRNVNLWLNLHGDQRQDLSLSGFGHYFYNFDRVDGYGISPNLNWRPRHNMQFSIGPEYTYFKDTWAWVTQMTGQTGEPAYFFSGYEQQNLSATLRADVTLSTELSLQFYAQSFLMGGLYSDYIQVTDPGALDFHKRFRTLSAEQLLHDESGNLQGIDLDGDGTLEYTVDDAVYSDFNFKQLSTNLVLRWEYRTGSTLYLVWSKGASDYVPDGTFHPGSDFSTLLDVSGNNVVMLKVNALLNL